MPHLCKSACKAKFVLKRAHARRARPHAHVGPGRMCRTLVLTDHNAQVVERLAANVALNRASNLAACEAVSVECLDWRDFLAPGPRREGGLGLTERDLLGIPGGPGPGGPGSGRGFLGSAAETTGDRTRYQVILGADVVYSHEAVEMLVSTVDALLAPTHDAVFLLAYVSRWPAVDEALTRSAARHRLILSEVLLPAT